MQLLVLFLFLGVFDLVSSDCSKIRPTDPNYERLYQERLDTTVYAQNWNPGQGNDDPDAGKRSWPKMLALLYQLRNNKTAQQEAINKEGTVLMFSEYAGIFYKPFSCAGYSMYYFEFKDMLPPAQLQKAKSMILGGGLVNTTRTDHHMDPLYNLTEFNSENFHWMMRVGGYLFSEEYNQVPYQQLFTKFTANLARSIYNLGRLEWDSNNYFGYVFYPMLVLREYAKDPAVVARAEAVLDWLMITSSLKFLDGWQASPDVRAKDNWMDPFDGSTWQYIYTYLLDSHYYPSAFTPEAVKAHTSDDLVGYPPWSSYRPPQVALDLVARRYSTPIEMHNGKPYWNVDNNDYEDWMGQTTNSRLFEFETLYLEEDYTLGSVASNRPDGKVGTFSEESLWSLTVRGNNYQPKLGAIQVFGNAGLLTTAEGRSPFEEIGQYANVMGRLINGSDVMFVALPSSIPVELGAKNSIFADLGSDVYMAWQSFGSLSLTSSIYINPSGSPVPRTKYTWTFDPNKLGALFLEVGTKKEFRSYENFKTAVTTKSSLQQLSPTRAQYVSSSGKTLLIEYQPTTAFVMVPGLTPAVVKPAGVTPKVWTDGNFVDFSKWNVYEVVSGENILQQKYGQAVPSLTATVGGKGVTITIDPVAAVPSCNLIG